MRPGFDEPDKRDGKRHKGDTVSVLDHAVVSDRKLRLAAREPVPWTRSYLRWAALTDAGWGLLGGGLALYVRFAGQGSLPVSYVAFAVALPALWCASVALAGGDGSRIIGAGSDEFRRVLNAAVGLAGGVAIVSYVFKIDFAPGYLVIALPSAAAVDLAARFRLRKRLPSVSAAVDQFGADTVAVLACPEMSGIRLRELAWELEEMGTDLCVAPPLIDVAGPRTTIRPVAGLPLLQLDHPELAGGKQVIKAVFDRVAAGLALAVLAPLFVVIAMAIRLDDQGPVFFMQTRVGRDGQTFRLFKFRTMVVDAEQRKLQLEGLNEGAGVLFKMRKDPRVTKVGAGLRRWSLDELPQLFNVVIGDMSMVGPRPALPGEVARYGDHMRRRLVVNPGITGLWQVSGRSGLSWEEAFRLDLRYVDNWSIVLDLQILWKTFSAVRHGSGAY